MAESEEGPVFNLMDIINQEIELEEESAAVLGGSDEKCCTYNTGYIKRQALYSCLTCCPDAKTDITKAAGICLACSYKCHENHELIELYTKRNFRCDCPTIKIPNEICAFAENSKSESTNTSGGSSSSNPFSKFQINNLNKYNQNFSGKYCFCNRPYPDIEDDVDDEMIQCVACEDWFHTRHLECDVIPNQNEYAEMICGKCVEENDFLKSYMGSAVIKVKPDNIDDSCLDVSTVENDEKEDKPTNGDEKEDKITNDEEKEAKLTNGDAKPMEVNGKTESDASTKDQLSDDMKKIELENDKNVDSNTNHEAKKREFEKSNVPEDETPSKKPKLDDDSMTNCKKPKISTLNSYKKGAIFWLDDWRSTLCTCSDCRIIYSDKKVLYLLDPEDTISAYEEKGISKQNAVHEYAAKLISSLGHTQKLDFLFAFNHLKEKLGDFFSSFANSGKVITESDVKSFFADLKNEHSKNNQDTSPQYFCR